MLSSVAEEVAADLTAVLRLIPARVLERLPQLVADHGEDAALDFLGLDQRMLRVALSVCEQAEARR